jgi:GNAT superfamily N-acetyltransferase
MPPVVLREPELPIESMTELVSTAGSEGHSFVVRLVRDFNSGAIKRADPQVALLVAWEHSRAVGVVVLSSDEKRPDIGRLRHLYVLPSHRGQGVGTNLCERALALARARFGVVHMSVPGPPRTFYERQGFARVFGVAGATHEASLR